MRAAQEIPDQVKRFATIILIFCCVIFVINLLWGRLGVGFPSYTIGSKGIGINGFFVAGNEMGAVFVVLSAFVLSQAFHRSLTVYIGCSLMICLIGVLIATKASMLSSVLLVLGLPVFIQGKKIFIPSPAKIVFLLLASLTLVLLTIKFIDILQNAGFWTRLVWIYEEQGILRVILSGRDEFAEALWYIFSQHAHWHQWLFGMSSATAKHFWLDTKLVAEIDPIDVLMIFGLLGLTVAALIQFTLLKNAVNWYKKRHSALAPACLLALIILESLAFTSGHIWLSGMMGPFLGLMFALCYLETQQVEQANLSLTADKRQ
jgi:hypothetical protein